MKSSSLPKLANALRKIEHDLIEANRLAARCQELQFLASQCADPLAAPRPSDPATEAQLRETLRAFLAVLDALTASPFHAMAQSPAILAASNSPKN